MRTLRMLSMVLMCTLLLPAGLHAADEPTAPAASPAAEQAKSPAGKVGEKVGEAVKAVGEAMGEAAKAVGEKVSEAMAGPAPTIKVDATELTNGGKLKVTGQAAPGKPVFIELWTEKQVRSNFFDSKPDKDGKIPYKLYLTEQLPAAYRIYLPKDDKTKEILAKYKADGSGWKYSEALKELGADVAYTVPAKSEIHAYQASILAGIIGSRGDLLPKLDDKESRRRSMQLVKSRFRGVGKLLIPAVDVKPDGSFSADIVVSAGGAPGNYYLAASTGKGERSQPVTIVNDIAFPNMYMSNAGTSVNIVGPFVLTLAISIFGVLMGAGGGFILNPLLLMIWPFPHTVVAGTVMPTVLFSQATGIYNYSRIKFISWKLGVSVGLAMMVGGFIGPKLTELITLDQFKMYFGYVLIVLAALMFWQTTPAYLEKNKKEQAILKEFKKRAEQAAK